MPWAFLIVLYNLVLTAGGVAAAEIRERAAHLTEKPQLKASKL
jgi:hypothetical protein